MNTAASSFYSNRSLHLLVASYALVWIVTAIGPRDWLTWALENLLVLAAVVLLVATYRRFAFSNFSYLLIAVFLSLHALGAHTGYSHAPLGHWVQEIFGLRRNPYDRVVHFAFGLLLAYPLRELLVRRAGVRGAIANWLPVSLILAASTCFEIIEAAVAGIVSPGTGPSWLGAQGDEWDPQLDMSASLLGASITMLITGVVIWFRKNNSGPLHSATKTKPFRRRHLLHILCLSYAIENLLVFVSVPVLVLSYRRLPLSDASYVLIFLFLVLHATGAHYSYSEVPLGYWLKSALHLQRNHFDRIVHFAFGLLMTYPMRDWLGSALRIRGFWATALPAAVIVSLSGFFEMIEALVARIVDPQLGAAYLGIQGDIWDAQKDMALAIAGAAFAVVCVTVIECNREEGEKFKLAVR